MGRGPQIGISALAVVVLASIAVVSSACDGEREPGANAAHESGVELAPLLLSVLTPAQLEDGPLRVVATTGIIGDIVGQVGGEAIALTTLMQAGQDPHSFEPAARDLTSAAEADVIFVNGWDLEESLVDDLAQIGEDVPLVPISAGITPRAIGQAEAHKDTEPGHDSEEHAAGGPDPHVWLDVANVQVWADNAAAVLSQLDPANGGIFRENAAQYKKELAWLDQTLRVELDALPAKARVLVTNHDSLGYFADAYGFEVVGTVMPGGSTLAEPSAGELALLVGAMKAAGVCSIFTDAAFNDVQARTVAAELDNCGAVQVVPLYTGSLGAADGDAANYIDMMKANVEAIVAGLR